MDAEEEDDDCGKEESNEEEIQIEEENEESETDDDDEDEEEEEEEIEIPNENFPEGLSTFRSDLIRNLNFLLCRVRKLIKLIRESTLFSNFVYKLIKSSESLREIDKRKIRGFILDFHVRWNSTYLMLNRFIMLKIVVNQITSYPENIGGLKPNQLEKIKNLSFSNENWDFLEMVSRNLDLLYSATKIISGRKYCTLSMSKFVQNMLLCYFKNNLVQLDQNILYRNSDLGTKEKCLKFIISEYLVKYFITKPSKNQKEKTIVSFA